MTPPERLLSDLRSALRVVWVAGMRRPDPSLPGELADLAIAARELGWAPLAATVDALRHQLGDDDVGATFLAARRVWVRVRLLQQQLGLHLLEAQLRAEAAGTEAVTPAPPRGRDGTVWPLGVVIDGDTATVHALDERGDWVSLEDRPVTMDREVPGPTRTVSRLFQGEVRWLDVAAGTLDLVRQPGTRTAARWVTRPAFHTHPRLRLRRAPGPAPHRVPPGARLAVGRARVQCTLTPDGWQARSGDAMVAVPALWSFDLDKRHLLLGESAVALDAVVVARGDRRELLQTDDPPRFPTLDPAATTASLATWQEGLPPEAAAQVAALAWPHLGGDRGALARALATAAQADDLSRRWGAQQAGLSLGLPPPDANPLARQRLGVEGAGRRPPLELLEALWLTERREPLGPTLAELLLADAEGPLDEDDAVAIALRIWLLARAGHEATEAFTRAHLDRWHSGHPLPDAVGAFWLHHAVEVARSVRADLPALTVPPLAGARLGLAALRGPSPVDGWRWVAVAGLLGWFLPDAPQPSIGIRK